MGLGAIESLVGVLFMLEIGNVLTIIGMILGLCVQAILVVNWMNSKFDAHRELIDEKHDKSEMAIIDLHQRVNKVKDMYVKKEDLAKDLAAMRASLTEIKMDINHQTGEMNSHLDRVIKILLDATHRKGNEQQ